jgi:hypothetical protein
VLTFPRRAACFAGTFRALGAVCGTPLLYLISS